MRKIFSILVVLMMVAGTFVSCSMPTNVDTSTSNNGSNTTAATAKVTVAKAAEGDGPICVINFNNKYYWCTVSALNIIEGKECIINTENHREPKYDGILYMYGGYAFDGRVVEWGLIYTEADNITLDFGRDIVFNGGNRDGKYCFKDDNIIYKY